MATNVKILKLLTGEELIAEVTSTTNDVCRMRNPVRIVVMPPDPRVQHDPKKAANIGFAPWAEFSNDRDFTIDNRHIVAIMTPLKEFVNQYNSMFGGIVLPTSNLLVPGA